MRYRRLAKPGELGQLRNTHRAAALIAQYGQQAQAGRVSKYFKLLGKAQGIALAERATAQGAALPVGGVIGIARGGVHAHSIKRLLPTPLY